MGLNTKNPPQKESTTITRNLRSQAKKIWRSATIEYLKNITQKAGEIISKEIISVSGKKQGTRVKSVGRESHASPQQVYSNHTLV